MKIKAGTLLTFEHGEYSDRGWNGPFVVLKDFDQAEVSDAYVAEWNTQDHEAYDSPSEYDFIAWMNKSGYVEDAANARSWYIGDYGFRPDIDTEDPA